MAAQNTLRKPIQATSVIWHARARWLRHLTNANFLETVYIWSSRRLFLSFPLGRHWSFSRTFGWSESDWPFSSAHRGSEFELYALGSKQATAAFKSRR